MLEYTPGIGELKQNFYLGSQQIATRRFLRASFDLDKDGVSDATEIKQLPGTVTAATELVYLHTDPIGSPVLSTQSDGSVLWREHYQPYGARQVKSLLSGNSEHWFASKPQDAESGLSYFGARYYDPVLGRFMGVDPVGANPARVHGLNRYAYANNNPYRYVDPDGRYADLAIEAASISVGVVSLGGNLWDGNYSDAGIDALGIAGDVTFAVVPGLPGGFGLGIKASRHVDEVADVAKNVGRNLPFKDADRLTEVNKTLDRIESSGPFLYKKDGTTFKNKEGLLPEGNYREYTVDTPRASNRGARRVIQDTDTSRTYYTDDHYQNFTQIDPTKR